MVNKMVMIAGGGISIGVAIVVDVGDFGDNGCGEWRQ